ncbi:MAG TPA: hypothetical protein ENG82_02685 [Bacteroidetes bacterium]|nr:hypothetical protein [Bacteroidota bacterium]HDL19269.1 hypothetical protein [Bacteroidota bacterium]
MEIDALIKEKDEFPGIKIKYQNQVDERKLKQITPVKRYFVLSKEDFSRRDQVMILPVDLFLALLSVSEKNL